MNSVVDMKSQLKGDVLVLRFSGRLDAVSTPSLEKQIFQYIDQGHHKLLFNFSGVDYISSAGMRMLLGVAKKLKVVSGQMVLCSAASNVMDVFTMAGFDHVLQMSRSEDEALSRF
jgi:anti-sigma B factor antagonist/stage II sporulation protein AA (anti-sigma F factor antagonist)